MNYIDFPCVQAAAEGLLAQVITINKVIEGINQVKRELSTTSFAEDMLPLLEKNAQEAEEELQVLKSSAECLQEIVRLYKKTEQGIADTYDLEQLPSLTPEIGVNPVFDNEWIKELFVLAE